MESDNREARKRRIAHLTLLGSLSLAGCAARVTPGLPPMDHPANPRAAEAVYVSPALTLRQEPQDAVRTSPHEPVMEGMEGMEHPQSETSPDPQKVDHGPGMLGARAGEALQPGSMYTCPMHPEVRSGKPGVCPKCGMKLFEKKESK